MKSCYTILALAFAGLNNAMPTISDDIAKHGGDVLPVHHMKERSIASPDHMKREPEPCWGKCQQIKRAKEQEEAAKKERCVAPCGQIRDVAEDDQA